MEAILVYKLYRMIGKSYQTWQWWRGTVGSSSDSLMHVSREFEPHQKASFVSLSKQP